MARRYKHKRRASAGVQSFKQISATPRALQMVWDAHMMSSAWCKCHCREMEARLCLAWQLFSPLRIAVMLSSHRSGPCGPDWLILLIYISIKSIIFTLQRLCGVMACGRMWLLVSGGERFQLCGSGNAAPHQRNPLNMHTTAAGIQA